MVPECTDLASLLEMDWMKTFKLAIEEINFAENNLSENGNFEQISGLVRKQRNDKRQQKKNTTKTRTFPGKTKGSTGNPTHTRRRRKRTRKIIQIRTLGENKRCR